MRGPCSSEPGPHRKVIARQAVPLTALPDYSHDARSGPTRENSIGGGVSKVSYAAVVQFGGAMSVVELEVERVGSMLIVQALPPRGGHRPSAMRQTRPCHDHRPNTSSVRPFSR